MRDTRNISRRALYYIYLISQRYKIYREITRTEDKIRSRRWKISTCAFAIDSHSVCSVLLLENNGAPRARIHEKQLAASELDDIAGITRRDRNYKIHVDFSVSVSLSNCEFVFALLPAGCGAFRRSRVWRLFLSRRLFAEFLKWIFPTNILSRPRILVTYKLPSLSSPPMRCAHADYPTSQVELRFEISGLFSVTTLNRFLSRFHQISNIWNLEHS